jgi:hypothetical protein
MKERKKLRMFENRILKGIFRLKRERVAGNCKIFNNEGIHNSSPNFIMITKSRMIRCVGHVAGME